MTPALSPEPRKKRSSAHQGSLSAGGRLQASQAIDSLEIFGRTVSVDLERSLQALSGLVDGTSIALLSPEEIR